MKKTRALYVGFCLFALGAFGVPLRADKEAEPQKFPAKAAPDWVVDGVIYQINTRAFTPEGTLAAAKKNLPPLAELGVSIVYLCPVFVSDDDERTEFWSPRQRKSGLNNPRNPYRMKDYYHVDPEYGTDDDLKAFIAEAHRLGQRVLLDLVYLHCGPTAVFIADHPNFVMRDADGKIINADWGFPKINLENPELREYLWQNMEYWVRDFGADGFRLDVGDGIALDFWKEARRRLEKIRPDVALLSEGMRAADQIEVMDVNYGFSFFSTLDAVMSSQKPVSAIRDNDVKVKSSRPTGVRFTRHFDNHDISNDDYENRRETRWGDAGNRAALFLCFTLDGVPMLYNGQEIADAERHSIFGRLPIDWNKAETDTGRGRFAFVRSLAELRSGNDALRRGTLRWLDNDRPEAALSFLRESESEKVLVVLNLTKEPVRVTVALEAAALTALAENGSHALDAGKASFDLPAFGFCAAAVE